MAGKMNAKKLAKMSEEERAIFFEQQRVAEEEAQKNKEEMLSRFLKDKLVKEEQATKLNIIKLKEQWRTIMRKGDDCYPPFLYLAFHSYSLVYLLFLSFTAKTEELKKDALVMKESYERVVDRKDAIIHSLARDTEEAEEQYPNHIDILLCIYNYCSIIIFNKIF